jgi:hypothetical protein
MNTSPQSTRFVPARFRALLTTGLLLFDGGLSFIAAIVLLLTLGPLSGVSLEDGADIGKMLIGLVALAQIAVRITTVVVFLMWLHRAYQNLRAFAPKTETSPGWAVGYWFIPFANLVRPFQVVKETWIKSDPAVDFSNGYAKASQAARSTTLLGFWWGFWLISNFADRVYGRMDWEGSASGFTFREALWIGAVSNLLTVVAALLAAWVVWTINQMQSEKSQQHGYDMWTTPPPPPANFDSPPPYGAGQS